VELLICGNININYLIESNTKKQPDSMMNKYNLIQIVNFPTRTSNDKETQIDNMFLDSMRLNCYSVYPMENGLSDHNAQIFILNKLQIPLRKINPKRKIRLINPETTAKFQMLLNEEAWDSVYNTDNINSMFNCFHCTFLNIFENSFPITYRSYKNKNNDWITNGIRISCKHKRGLYVLSRNSDNFQLKDYYNRYCAILRKVIREAKKLH
jgi:hypothetical protein